MKRNLKNGLLVSIGYILSPLSFWNDIFVNLPIAYAFGFLFGLVSQSLFLPFMIIGYWLSNIAGLMMIHYGAVSLMSTPEKKYTKKNLLKNLAISLIYTLVIIILVWLGWLKLPTEYFQ